MSETRKPSLELLIQAAMESRLSELHVSLPCKVLNYDGSKQTVSLQPLIKRKLRKADGTVTSKDLGALQNVPVAFPRCAGGWITFPLAAGDIGMAVFAERSIGEWMGARKGDTVAETDETLHPLAGAWFYPGGYPASSPLSGGADSSNVVIHAEQKLDLGEKGLTDDALGTTGKMVEDALSTLKSAISGAAVVPNDGGAAFKANILLALTTPPWPPSLKVTKARLK